MGPQQWGQMTQNKFYLIYDITRVSLSTSDMMSFIHFFEKQSYISVKSLKDAISVPNKNEIPANLCSADSLLGDDGDIGQSQCTLIYLPYFYRPLKRKNTLMITLSESLIINDTVRMISGSNPILEKSFHIQGLTTRSEY